MFLLSVNDVGDSIATSLVKSESMQKSTKIVNSWQGSKNQNRSSFA